MDETCFVESDVYEGTKVNDILDLSRYLHASLKVLKVYDTLLHYWGRVAVTRVAVWLCKFFCNVGNCCFANAVFFCKLLLEFCSNLFVLLD